MAKVKKDGKKIKLICVNECASLVKNEKYKGKLLRRTKKGKLKVTKNFKKASFFLIFCKGLKRSIPFKISRFTLLNVL